MSAVIQRPLTEVELRAKVFALERAMKADQRFPADPKEVCPVTHHFCDGVYAREMFIPAGTVVVGKIHKRKNFNIMSRGKLTILTPDGLVTLLAGHHVVSEPGTKRVAYAHEDTIWTTILGTELTDPEEIETAFVANSEQEYLAFVAALENKNKEH